MEQQRMAYEQARQNLMKLNQDTLEIRLSTEELWVSLSRSAAPDALKKSIAAIREKFAYQYQKIREQLDKKKAELTAYRDDIARQIHSLQLKKEAIEQSIDEQSIQLAQKRQLLEQKENQLKLKETQLLERIQNWQIEKMDFQRSLRTQQNVLLKRAA